MTSIILTANSSLAGDAGPNPVTRSLTALFRVSTLLFLVTITNFNYTIYHFYMRKKPEFSNRLLNVLYSVHAYLLQFGSLLILLIFCDSAYGYRSFSGWSRHFLSSPEVLMTVRMFHLSCVFINIFFIGMATILQNFKMDFYLLISVKINEKIICLTLSLISILLNIFVRFSLKGKRKDEKLRKYQSVINTVCVCLNLFALIFCLLVISRKMILYLKKKCFIGSRNCFFRKQVSITPVVEIELNKIEVVNIEPSNNTVNNNNNINNYNIAIEENIRSVKMKSFLSENQ